MFESPLRIAAISFLCLLPVPAHAVFSIKVCRNLEQSYEQIERGASSIEVNATLFSAADKGCVDLAKLLLQRGASLEARDRFGAKPLARAAAAGHAEMVKLFLDSGAPVDARDLDGSTALYKAAESGRLPIIRILVERGAGVNLPGRSGITPLSAAAYMGSAPIVQFLIEKGADLNEIDATQKGALVYAAGRGFTPVARLLLDHGVDVNAHYGHNLTALMWAAGHSSEAGTKDIAEVMTLLIERGALIDERDDRGRTALMIAAELDHEAAVDLLLAHGADKSLKDNQGKTAGDLTSLTALRDKLALR
jgi:uncharacterized protein